MVSVKCAGHLQELPCGPGDRVKRKALTVIDIYSVPGLHSLSPVILTSSVIPFYIQENGGPKRVLKSSQPVSGRVFQPGTICHHSIGQGPEVGPECCSKVALVLGLPQKWEGCLGLCSSVLLLSLLLTKEARNFSTGKWSWGSGMGNSFKFRPNAIG